MATMSRSPSISYQRICLADLSIIRRARFKQYNAVWYNMKMNRWEARKKFRDIVWLSAESDTIRWEVKEEFKDRVWYNEETDGWDIMPAKASFRNSKNNV